MDFKQVEMESSTEPILESLLIGNTSRCNFDCRYCGRPTEDNLSLSYKTLTGLIDSIPALKRFKFSGGEATLEYGCVKKVIEYCSKKGIESQLNTNGTLLSKSQIDELDEAGLDIMHFGFDSLNEHQFKYLHRVPVRLYPKLIENIKYSTRKSFKTVCETLVSKWTADKLLEIHNKVYELGVRIHEIQPAMPSGCMRWAYILPPKKLASTLVNLLKNKKKEVDIFIDCLYVNECSPYAKSLFAYKDVPDVSFVSCIDGWNEVYIHSNGDVMICNIGSLHNPIGNIYKDNIVDIFLNSKAINEFRTWSKTSGKCGTCDKWGRCRNMCQGVVYGMGEQIPSYKVFEEFAPNP